MRRGVRWVMPSQAPSVARLRLAIYPDLPVIPTAGSPRKFLVFFFTHTISPFARGVPYAAAPPTLHAPGVRRVCGYTTCSHLTGFIKHLEFCSPNARTRTFLRGLSFRRTVYLAGPRTDASAAASGPTD